MKYFKKFLLLMSCVFIISGCDINGLTDLEPENSGACTTCSSESLDLDAINEYFSTDTKWVDFNGYGNKVTLIPFTHINGPRDQWDFFAIVNFEYSDMLSVKYQITYLSCTCRSSDVNYWQTMYLQLSRPFSRNVNDIEILNISFEKDDTGDYLAGFWGDSGIQALEADGINHKNIFYEDIRDIFIPYLIGKKYSYMKTLSVVEDINENDFAAGINPGVTMINGKTPSIANFYGSSVSTNNLIRVINSAMKYHAERYL